VVSGAATAPALSRVGIERLRAQQAQLAAAFANEGPFPHPQSDDFLAPHAADALAR